MSSTVGVLIDELSLSMRTRVEAALLRRPRAFWKALARKQISATVYRLIYRPAFYPAGSGRNQLPLPPAEKWAITLGRGPKPLVIDGHRLIGVEYTLSTVLVTDRDSPAAAEPTLARAGGNWSERFVLPADPELLFQRTGYACMDELEFPPNSVDEENALTFYDHTCDVATPGSPGCHLTVPLPEESCTTALAKHVGRIHTSMRFERLPWTAALAASHRVGAVTNPSVADLAAVPAGLSDNRIEYRYIAPDSCALAEKCVGGPGWRRLLKFTASLNNSGGAPLHIGPIDYFITGENTPNQQHHLFEHSTCHNHYHFTHYANFAYGARPGDKRAFCLETTQRYFNNETTPLVSPYFGCSYQGISPGWGDDYAAGIECQWIDITDIDTRAGPVTQRLSFTANPDGFLCEGTPILDDQGRPTYVSTPFTTERGEPVDRFACQASPSYDANNRAAFSITLPRDGGMVTSPCARGQLGPRRDCGFRRQDVMPTCAPGLPVTMHCALPSRADAQIVRVCETSAALNTGVACTLRTSLANAVLASSSTSISFTCPAPRDVAEPGGRYAIYVAPAFGEDSLVVPTCDVR